MPQPKAQAIPEEKWAHYEPYIRHFLVAKGMQVEEVVTELARHNFHIKKSQLEHRISRWQIGKAIRPEIWRHVGLQIAKRRRENRESRVIHRGKTLELSKVKDQTARNRTFTYQASPDSSLMASAQVVVCTPPVLPYGTEWPSDLPWLRFYDKTFVPLASHALRAMSLNPSTTRGQRALTAESIVTNVHRSNLLLLSADPKLQVSKLETMIGTTMPEYYPGENWNRAQSLLKGSEKGVLQASLSIVLYNLSNNLFDPFDNNDWKVKVQVLHDCGIMSLPLPSTIDDVTMNGITRSLFHAALWRLTGGPKTIDDSGRAEALAVLRWILSAGRIPAPYVFMPHLHATVSPLYAAVHAGRIELVKLLLQAGASPSFTPNASLGSPLELALRLKDDPSFASSRHAASERLDIIHALLKHCALARLDETLRLAVESRDMEIAKMILQATPHILDNPEEPVDPLLSKIVHEAADHEDAWRLGFVISLLPHLCPARPTKDFITAETFIAAASRGHKDNILLLYGVSPGGMPMERSGFTPLHAAAKGGHQETCALLLSLYGSDVLNSCCCPPLHMASRSGCAFIVQLFIDEGANVNAVSTADSPGPPGWYDHRFSNPGSFNPFSALDIIRQSSIRDKKEFDRCAAALIRAGARVITGDIVLAVKKGYPEMLSAALDFGGDPNEMSKEGLTALQLSLRQTSPFYHAWDHTAKTARLLLGKGASVNGGEAKLAALLGDWILVDRLLPEGELLLDFDVGYMTALQGSLKCSDTVCLSRVMQLQPFIYTPQCLCAAIENEQYWVIDHLLANRGTRSQPDCLEGTAICLAMRLEGLALLRKLLATLIPQPITATMDRDQDTWSGWAGDGSEWLEPEYCGQVSPLAVAVHLGDVDAFHELLHQGFLADRTTWSIIGSKGNLSMAQALVDDRQSFKLDGLGSSEVLTDPFISQVPLPGSNTLISSDPIISSDPLICSLKSRNKDLVLLILKSYPNINRHYWLLEEGSGFTPLQAATDTGQADLVELFLQRGADVNAPPAIRNGATALQFAAIRGHLGIAKRLIDLGADTNAPAALINGRTSLEGAAENGRLDMLQLLFKRGTLTKYDGRHQYIRAIKLAIKEGHCEAERLLRGHRNWEEEDHILFELKEDFERQKSYWCGSYFLE